MSADDVNLVALLSFDRQHSIHCPRCGYDQRGIMATWIQSCPLTGICTECGLEMAWAEVLNPNIIKPRWCVEYVHHSSALPWASVKTFAMTFWRWRFWRTLKMSHPP